MDSEVGAGECSQLSLELLERRGDRAVLGDALGGYDDPVQAVPGGTDAEPLVRPTDLVDHRVQFLRRSGHLHLTSKPLDLGRLAGEADAEQLADRAAAAVAADEVARAQPRAVGQLDRHAVIVLAQADQFAAAPDVGTEFGSVLGQ